MVKWRNLVLIQFEFNFEFLSNMVISWSWSLSYLNIAYRIILADFASFFAAKFNVLKGETEMVLKTWSVLKYFEKGILSFLPDLKRSILS